VNFVKHKILIQYLFIFSRPSKTLPGVMISLQMILWHWSMRGLMLIMKVRAARSCYVHTVSFGVWLGKARQGKFIYIAHFIHSGNSKCFTWKKLK